MTASHTTAGPTLDWTDWIDKVEELLGDNTLDGDREADGYSLDDFYEQWVDGDSPETAANQALREIAKRLHPSYR